MRVLLYRQQQEYYISKAGPTLKPVKPLLEAPINLKKSTKPRPRIRKKKKKKATKTQFRGISGKEKEKEKKKSSAKYFFLDQPLSVFVCFFLLLSCLAPLTNVSLSPLLFLLLFHLSLSLSFNFLVLFLCAIQVPMLADNF